jgi:hypothetical protein
MTCHQNSGPGFHSHVYELHNHFTTLLTSLKNEQYPVCMDWCLFGTLSNQNGLLYTQQESGVHNTLGFLNEIPHTTGKGHFPLCVHWWVFRPSWYLKRLITNIAGKQITHFTWKWKLPTMYAVMYLQISLSTQRYIMHEGKSNENLVSAKKLWSYCVQLYADQIISIGYKHEPCTADVVKQPSCQQCPKKPALKEAGM